MIVIDCHHIKTRTFEISLYPYGVLRRRQAETAMAAESTIYPRILRMVIKTDRNKFRKPWIFPRHPTLVAAL